MALKNQAITPCYTAFDASTGLRKTGDVANHTIYVIKDGVAALATNAAAEVDATHAPGEYSVALTAGEMNANTVVVTGKSSTANIEIVPVKITTERGVLPAVAPNAAGGLLITAAGSLDMDEAVADIDDIQTRLPSALVGGKMDSHVNDIAANAITAASIATDAIDEIWAIAMSDLAAVPAASASALDALNWCFQRMRNKRDQSGTTETLYKDDDTTPVASAGKSDTGGLLTVQKFA